MSNDAFKQMVNAVKKNTDSNKTGASIFSSGDHGIPSYVPFGVRTGIPQLDYHLFRGGLPAGKIIEYFGFEYCGKTTAALMAIAEVQKIGGYGIFVDTEMGWDPERATELGVDVNRVAVVTAFTIEDIFNQLEEVFQECANAGLTSSPILAVVDSVTGVPTLHEAEVEITKEARVGQEAKQIRRGVRRLQGILSKTKALCIFINHAVAANITGPAFAKKSQAAGGHGIKFMAHVRVEFKNSGQLKDGSGKDLVRHGQKVDLLIEKLRNAPLSYPLIREIELKANGFDRIESLLQGGLKSGWLSKVNNQTYALYRGTDQEITFKKSEWPQIIEGNGGFETLYDAWVQHAVDSGQMKLYGQAAA